MKRQIFLLLLTVLVGGFAGGVQPAAAYHELRCGCDPGEEGCSCTPYDFTLGKSATVEFHALCTQNDDTAPPPGISIQNRDKGTTCTITASNPFVFKASDNYATKSCTNWDPFSKDDLKIVVNCSPSSYEPVPEL